MEWRLTGTGLERNTSTSKMLCIILPEPGNLLQGVAPLLGLGGEMAKGGWAHTAHVVASPTTVFTGIINDHFPYSGLHYYCAQTQADEHNNTELRKPESGTVVRTVQKQKKHRHHTQQLQYTYIQSYILAQGEKM